MSSQFTADRELVKIDSTGSVWVQHDITPLEVAKVVKLMSQRIEELEREIDRLKMRILSLEVANQNVVYRATEMWKHGAIREWLDIMKKETKP